MLPPGERRCVRRRDRHTDRRTDARLLQDVTVPWQYRPNLGIHSIRLRSLREFKQHFSGPWSIHSPKIDINPPARFRATSLRSRQRGKGGGSKRYPRHPVGENKHTRPRGRGRGRSGTAPLHCGCAQVLQLRQKVSTRSRPTVSTHRYTFTQSALTYAYRSLYKTNIRQQPTRNNNNNNN